ncbi:MAG: hypothetical protein ACR2QF_01785 [Geminicoccaceae bacterium]
MSGDSKDYADSHPEWPPKDEPQGWPEDHPLGRDVPKTDNDLQEVSRKVDSILDQSDPEDIDYWEKQHEKVLQIEADNRDDRDER